MSNTDAGAGLEGATGSAFRACPTCDGRGRTPWHGSPLEPRTIARICRECGGSGVVPLIARQCLRLPDEPGRDGPCSAGLCSWPDCLSPNTV